MKSQVIVNGTTWQVICTAQGRGPTHDFALYKQSKVEPEENIEMLADSGYQGLDKLPEKSKTPKKRSKKGSLTKAERKANRELSRRRIEVEKVIRSLKIFRILLERYRNRRKRFSLRFNLIAGLYNFELSP
jgi:DDE superfamily endonuclease